ncbi:MAG: hypothetical protein IPI65_08465 [Bacteroidetes bacterium]|nr:hypothetical protein [Bacteroidota bacterium]
MSKNKLKKTGYSAGKRRIRRFYSTQYCYRNNNSSYYGINYYLDDSRFVVK